MCVCNYAQFYDALAAYRSGCASVMNCPHIDVTSKDLCSQESWMSLILEPFGPMTIPILGSSPVHGRKLGESKESATLQRCSASENFDRANELHDS